MKHLPKHLRPRWRYIVVALETWPDTDLDETQVQAAFWTSARSLLGDPGGADADIRVLSFEYAEGDGMILVRVRRGMVAGARAAIACVADIGGAPVGLRVVGVSGTVRAAEEKYLNAPTRPGTEDDVVFESVARRAVPRGNGRVDLHDRGEFTGATQLDLE